MTVDPNHLTRDIAAIEKQYGKDIVHIGEQEDDYRDLARIPTGSIELDYAMGGGIPLNRISRLWGSYHSGKSFIAWNVIKNAQKMGMTCAYYNVENQYDERYVKKIGVNVESLIRVDDAIIERVGAQLETLLGSVHIHVIDSCSGAISLYEVNAKPEDMQIGLASRAWAKVFRRATNAFNEDNAIIIIDQARDTMGFGGGEHPPGGRFIEHASSLTAHFKRGGWLHKENDILVQKDGVKKKTLSGSAEPDGQEIQVRVTKNRCGPPYRTARVYYDFEGCRLDSSFEYVKAAKFFGIIQVTGSWMVLPDGTKLQGEAKLRQEIMTREYADIRKAVRKAMKQLA